MNSLLNLGAHVVKTLFEGAGTYTEQSRRVKYIDSVRKKHTLMGLTPVCSLLLSDDVYSYSGLKYNKTWNITIQEHV